MISAIALSLWKFKYDLLWRQNNIIDQFPINFQKKLGKTVDWNFDIVQKMF